MNGLRPAVDPSEGEAFLVGSLIEGDAPLEATSAWLKARCTAARPAGG
jgi:hypothetical protein